MSINRIKLRDDTMHELRVHFSRVLSGMDGLGATKSCMNCSNFEESTELCKKYLQRPPARVIAYSCEAHDDINDIPL